MNFIYLHVYSKRFLVVQRSNKLPVLKLVHDVYGLDRKDILSRLRTSSADVTTFGVPEKTVRDSSDMNDKAE